MEADFSGYATKHDLLCSDGRTIREGAFKHNDKLRVPLVWAHQHDGPENILGHAILEYREDGVYTYGFFNETPNGQYSKTLVKHKDVTALSIFANGLRQQGANVIHGNIREVSIVMAGANPEAFIDYVNLQHGDGEESSEAIIFTGLTLEHENLEETADPEETVEEVIESLSEKQKDVVFAMLSSALEKGDVEDVEHSEKSDDEKSDDEKSDDEKSDDEKSDDEKSDDEKSDDEKSDDDEKKKKKSEDDKSDDDSTNNLQHNHQEGTSMSRNVFDQSQKTVSKGATLSHDQIKTLIADGVKLGSMKESYLLHAEDYGITDINLLFPDARNVGETPELIARQAEWVPKVLNATKHAPFAKIKSLMADLTGPEARAKGYIKGNEKTEEVIKMLRRTTGPATVYKKQKLDRDDILDITDFDVIAWLKWEIRFMLNEEIARAILVGDGRSSLHDDKVKDPEGAVDGTGIRSIANDNDLYAHKVDLVANVSATEQVDEITRARSDYRGSGSPTYYTTDKNLTDILLLKDKVGRRLYATVEELASTLRVKEIVSVEVMEEYPSILGILVNLTDYTIGSNRGGELTFFEDFDIDFNQNKYLLETRISGALTKPKSAIVIRRELGTQATVTPPAFDGATNKLTVPTANGVDYLIAGTIVTGVKTITAETTLEAKPKAGFYFAPNTTKEWTFNFTAV